jgi:hypothetical protein
MRRILVFALATLCPSLAAAPAFAAAQDIQLTFGTLPSAQGFVFTPSGSHAGAVEANIFSVDGTKLMQNSIGQGYGVSGGSILYVKSASGLVTTTEAKQLIVRMRCLQVEGSGGGANGEQGVAFGFTHGSIQFDFSVTPTRIYTLGAGGTIGMNVNAGPFDNSSAFHTYLLDWTPPNAFKIYRDGVLVHSGSGGFGVSANRVFLGDGTGGANAKAEIDYFRFLQGTAVPVELSRFSVE